MKILSKLDNTGMIEEVADKRYVTDAEKSTWNSKADKAYVDNKVKTDVPENAVFTDTPTDISGKQDKLTAGDNIIITNNTISATDTVYDDTAVQAELGKKADKTNEHTHDNKSTIDKFSEVEGKPFYNGEEIGGAVPNLTLTELTLGNYKIVFNEVENSLDFEVIQ